MNRKGQAFPRSILPSSAAAASGSRENRPTQICVGVVSPQRFLPGHGDSVNFFALQKQKNGRCRPDLQLRCRSFAKMSQPNNQRAAIR
jgi:hypothetical protein